MAQCPSCRGAMTERAAERLYGRSMAIDVCPRCEGIWFDGQELLQLAPAATLALLSDVVPEQTAARAPLAPALACPRCQGRLLETHDRQRNTPFVYYRCPRGHGKFLTFFQFLRAKNFVRPLDDQEVAELRKGIHQVNCVNCGAPVDIERAAVCGFCRTPLTMLDPQQVRKAVEELRQKIEVPERERQVLPLSLAQERLRAERAFAQAEGRTGGSFRVLDVFEAGNPITSGLRLLQVLLRV